MTISCTAIDPGGVVHSVSADLSQIGGSDNQAFVGTGNGQWLWTGMVTPPIAGTRTIKVTATGHSGLRGLGTATVVVAAVSGEPLVITSVAVGGALVQGQPAEVALTCTAASTGTVQSVVADFSGVGGPSGMALRSNGSAWVWTGVITASIAGAGTVMFLATDDRSNVVTQTADVVIAPPAPTVTDISLIGTLTNGAVCSITLSCTAASVSGTVQSVTADLSQIGGSAAQALVGLGNGPWIWSGNVTPSANGIRTITLTATDVSARTGSASLSVPSGGSGTPSGQVGDNIALGRPYTWNVAPNYLHCTDVADTTQLTDGQYTKGSGFWTQMSTVGWQRSPLVEVTVDLGRVEPIQGVSFSTAADRGTNVSWPLSINVLVSENGAAYYHLGELISLSAEQGLPAIYGRLATHRYRTDRLASHGRFVRFVVAAVPFLFIDEIEIYRGPDHLLNAPFADAPISDMVNLANLSKVRSGTIRRIVLDAQDVLAQAQAEPQLAAATRDQMASQLASIIDQAVRLPAVDPSTFRATLPLNNLHAQVFRSLASLWRAQGRAGLTAWQTPLWAPLQATQAPGANQPVIDMTMMSGEYRAGAFNLSNATDAEMVVHLSIHGLPGGTNPSYISVKDVIWTDTQPGIPAAAALPDAASDGDGFAITIPSGMTKQVWLTFHPTAVAAGTYNGLISVDARSNGQVNVPVQLRVSALRFPTQPTLSVEGWDYSDRDRAYDLTPQNRDAFIANLQEHFVDTTWATSAVMPMKANPQPQDFTAFDTWVGRWPGARTYRIFLNVGATFNEHPMGTASFNAAVGTWASAHAAHWRQMGIDPRTVGLLLVDEPTTAEQSARITAWANAIRAAVPDVRIWEDPVYENAQDAASTFSACDVLCVHMGIFYSRGESFRSLCREQRNAGKDLAFYSTWPASRLQDPYAYYRLQAWLCWQEGATEMGYWAFGDSGYASSWNEYLATSSSCTPLFLDAASVTTGKHMEAIREGVEDHEYLTLLGRRIAEMETAGVPAAQLSQAKALLAQAADRVLRPIGPNGPEEWSYPKDRETADTVRIEVLNMLESLEAL